MSVPEKFKEWKTDSFNLALLEGRCDEAEEWLAYIKANRLDFLRYDDTWIDHRERALFDKYLLLAWAEGISWYQQAKAIVVNTLNPRSQQARRDRLEQVTAKKFDDI